jgi:hypothetical protein
MSEPVLIAFSGKKMSGKGTLCKFLIRNRGILFEKLGYGHQGQSWRTPSITIFPMAGPLKAMCINILGLEEAQVYGTNEQKDTLTRYRWQDLPHYATFRQTRFDGEEVPSGPMTGRQVMQHVGTMFRMLHKDIWAEACIRSINDSGAAVALIDDIRYPNEVEAVQKAGGLVLRLTRDIFAGADQHESETALDPGAFDWDRFDGIIDNHSLNTRQTYELLVEQLIGHGVVLAPIQSARLTNGV